MMMVLAVVVLVEVARAAVTVAVTFCVVQWNLENRDTQGTVKNRPEF